MIDADELRQVLAAWAGAVSVAACRVEGRVVATTVTACLPLSIRPPLVLLALGPNATVRPFLRSGASLGISVLHAGQRRFASIFADPLPVGPDPFSPDPAPTIPDSLIELACTVERADEGGDHAIIIARVDSAARGAGAPLVRYDRKYHSL